jgi:CTP:phosphocholine cytidylyltransferase-like protein
MGEDDDDDEDLYPQDKWDNIRLDLLAETTMTMEEMEADKLYDNDSLSDLYDKESNNIVTHNHNNNNQ